MVRRRPSSRPTRGIPEIVERHDVLVRVRPGPRAGMHRMVSFIASSFGPGLGFLRQGSQRIPQPVEAGANIMPGNYFSLLVGAVGRGMCRADARHSDFDTDSSDCVMYRRVCSAPAALPSSPLYSLPS